MRKGIISHVTINGVPVCQFSAPYLHEAGWLSFLKTCSYRSLYAARNAARLCKTYQVKAVRGECPHANDTVEDALDAQRGPACQRCGEIIYRSKRTNPVLCRECEQAPTD